MDFTLKTYKVLLQNFQQAGYVFYTFEKYLKIVEAAEQFVLLRHDIDAKAGNALAVAEVEAELGIRASYYFRIVPQSNQPEIIKQIAALGHEIGYHYEDLSLSRGDWQEGIKLFKEHLQYFSKFYPIKTICMHGSPRSKWDSKDLWRKYNYKEFGTIGEPYFDIDFSKIFYLTDTGRRWDGFHTSVRDKIEGHQERWIKEGLVYHATKDIISATKEGRLPNRIMITVHPQRWNTSFLPWIKELAFQSIKNVVKKIIIIKSV